MSHDTDKLIRQLSLISYLMAERRPVTAPEIRRDVEGYSVMNEDAFARRFYADRSELEALGIALAVEKPVDGLVEQENYSLPPENFHLPAIEFTDKELAALLLFYARDGFLGLRLATDLSAWWDTFGREVPAGALEELIDAYPAFGRVLPVAGTGAERLGGAPGSKALARMPRSGLPDPVPRADSEPSPESRRRTARNAAVGPASFQRAPLHFTARRP